MTHEEQELARRLVAHPRWRWMCGMFAISPTDTVPMLVVLGSPNLLGDRYPDISNPGTQGWMVDSFGEDLVSIAQRPASAIGGEKWTVLFVDPATGTRNLSRVGLSRGEALARARLAAWGEL
jgi:hypothetical protein